MLGRLELYDALYSLAADEGREEALFGDCRPLAREAFSRSLAGDAFPAVWFEVPLAGKPRFDLHVAISREALAPGTTFVPGSGNGCERVLRWYADEEAGGAGLAFAYDVSEGAIDFPAVHVNTNNAPLSDIGRFFELVAGTEAAKRYEGFEARLPRGWRVWYAGVHPARPCSPVRVDCFVEDNLKAAYASAPSLFEEHLRRCGFTATSAALLDLVGLVTRSLFPLELQFDVLEDGLVGPTIGVSAGFPMAAASRMRSLFEEGGAAGKLLEQVEQRGLADERWRLVPGTIHTTLVDTGGMRIALYNMPTFMKLRLREGDPLDAKIYLQAGADA